MSSVEWTGLLLLALGIGMLQTLLGRSERLDGFDSRGIGFHTITRAASLAAFIWHELHTPHPVIDLRIFLNRQFAIGCVIGAVLGVCLYATVFVLPVYLQQSLGFTANQTGMVILPGALASAFSMGAVARLLGKVDGRRIAAASWQEATHMELLRTRSMCAAVRSRAGLASFMLWSRGIRRSRSASSPAPGWPMTLGSRSPLTDGVPHVA